MADRRYPGVDAILALTYPAGYFFERGRLGRAGFIIQKSAKDFGLHGLFEPRTIRSSRDSVFKRMNVHFPAQFVRRLMKVMPHLTKDGAIQSIDQERRKHGKNLSFLTDHTYPKFAVGLMEMYQFHKLLGFVFDELRSNDVRLTEISYFGEDWIGIRLGDLISICERYPPICVDNADRKLTFRLIKSNLSANLFVIYEVLVGVTRNKMLLATGPPSNLVADDVVGPPQSPDSIIALCNVLDF